MPFKTLLVLNVLCLHCIIRDMAVHLNWSVLTSDTSFTHQSTEPKEKKNCTKGTMGKDWGSAKSIDKTVSWGYCNPKM